MAFWTDQSYVNRPNTKKAERRRKKEEKRKEQESAEAFSGLKRLRYVLARVLCVS